MDAAYAAYLDQVRAHRAELGEAMAALEAALALPVGLGVTWRRRVRAALTELAHDLRDHVGITEAEGALYTDIRTSAPRLTHGVKLQAQGPRRAARRGGAPPRATRRGDARRR